MLHCPCRFTSRSADAARGIAARKGVVSCTVERDLVPGVHQGDTVAVGAVKDLAGNVADVILGGVGATRGVVALILPGRGDVGNGTAA